MPPGSFGKQPDRSPFTSMDADATMQHELFESYIRAGFSRSEALELLKTIVATNLAASHEADRKSK